jgi:hypothetical protein
VNRAIVALGSKWRDEVDQERIFLSAVSNEFGAGRRALARTLRGPGNDVPKASR